MLVLVSRHKRSNAPSLSLTTDQEMVRYSGWFSGQGNFFEMTSVLWHCWLGDSWCILPTETCGEASLLQQIEDEIYCKHCSRLVQFCIQCWFVDGSRLSWPACSMNRVLPNCTCYSMPSRVLAFTVSLCYSLFCEHYRYLWFRRLVKFICCNNMKWAARFYHNFFDTHTHTRLVLADLGFLEGVTGNPSEHSGVWAYGRMKFERLWVRTWTLLEML